MKRTLLIVPFAPFVLAALLIAADLSAQAPAPPVPNRAGRITLAWDSSPTPTVTHNEKGQRPGDQNGVATN